jgi:hypothetical protein
VKHINGDFILKIYSDRRRNIRATDILDIDFKMHATDFFCCMEQRISEYYEK